MERVQYLCDVCGISKADSNHWWKMHIDGTRLLSFAPWCTDLQPTTDGQKFFHLCGHECAIVKLSGFMSPEAPQRPQVSARPPAESSSTQENTESVSQPQWTEGGSITGAE